MPSPLRVLILEDELADAELMVRELRRAGFDLNWQRVEAESDYIAHLDPALDIILADYKLPQFNAMYALQCLQERALDVPFIVVSGAISEEVAVECMKRGATDYMFKDRLARLGQAVTQALEQRRLRRERKRAEDALREMNVALAHAMPGISRLDLAGRYVTVNEAYARMIGYEPGEMIGMDWVPMVHPEDRGNAITAYHRMVSEGKAEFEARAVRKDGSVFHKHVLMVKIVDRDDTFVGHHCFMRDITERKRAAEAVLDSERRFARLQMALAQLAQRKVLQDGDLKAACRNITAVAVDALDVERASVWLYNEDRSKIHCVDLYERSLDLHSIKREIAVTTYPAYFKALEEERIIAAHDCRTDPRTAELTDSYLLPLGVTSMLDAPIRWRAKISGTICVEHVGNSRTWSSEEQNFVGSLADFVSLALEAEARQRAEEALAHALKERESIMDTIPDILYLLDLGGNLVRWNRRVEIITGLSPSELRGRPALEFFPEEDRAIIAEAIRTAFEQGYADAEGRLLTKDGTPLPYHWTGVPLVDGHGNVIGLTGVGRDITDRKHAETTRQALYQASLAIQEPLELKERLNRLLQTARDVLHLDRLNIFLADPEGRWLQSVASLGTEEPLEAIRVPIGPEGAGIAQAYLTSQMIFYDGQAPVPDDLRLKPPYDSVEAFRSRAFILLPLIVQGRAIGVMGADRKHTRRPLEPAMLELVQLFATQAAIAIQSARLLEQVQAGRERLQALSRKLVAVQEAERHHLARELHDEIGQMLTGVKLTLEMSMRSSPDAIRSTLSEALGQLNDLMARVRTLSLDLRPAMLDDLGLVPALLWHFERYTAQTSVRVDFRQAELEGRLGPELETAVYRIVQEALTNVARHAGVNEATVILCGGQDILGVQVQDQGRGFNPATALGANTSSGLAGMSERAELLGGHMTVESAPGAGTSVTVKFPVTGRIDKRKKPR